jgi:phosphoserine phosphatase
VAASLLDHTLTSVETFTTFALCIGTVVLIVTQSRDVMDEYYEHELKKMLDALLGTLKHTIREETAI